MPKFKLEYIWLDGYEPVPNLRSKTKIVEFAETPTLEQLPVWNFDGSSTRQAEGSSSDCLLQPVALFPDPARTNGMLVMCEVLLPDGTAHPSNSRSEIPDDPDTWFGFDLNIGRSALAAFTITVIMDVWHWTPLVTLTLIAALVSLPSDPFEQAQIDGASKTQIFWHITLPMIRPALIATVFIRLMDALRTVDEVLMLTGGGPGSATRYVGVHIFKEVFPRTNYGYGSAISVIVLYLTIVVCWLLYVSLIAPRNTKEES